MRDAARRVAITTGETVLSVRDCTAMLADLTLQGLDAEEMTAEMTATKTLADFPALAAKLAEVLSEPPEFGARQPYGGDFEVCDADVGGHATIDVGVRAGTTDVTFVAITGEANSKGGRDEVCADALAMVAAVCNDAPATVALWWPPLSVDHLYAAMTDDGPITQWFVADYDHQRIRIDICAGHDRLDLSCEPA